MNEPPSDLWRRFQRYRASPLFGVHQGFGLKRYPDKTVAVRWQRFMDKQSAPHAKQEGQPAHDGAEANPAR